MSWLLSDPRRWTRDDVHGWLRAMRVSVTDAQRFRMNGKALCLMTLEMFAYRVTGGGEGRRLHGDFQARLCRAVAISLHRACAGGAAGAGAGGLGGGLGGRA